MKRSLYVAHKWLALLFSLPLFVLSITGLVMTLETKSPPPKLEISDPLPVHQLLRKLKNERGDVSIPRVNINEQTITAFVKSDSMMLVTVERGEGKIIKEENPVSNPFMLSKTIHESFFMKGPGKIMVAISGLGLTLILLSGFFFWVRKNFTNQLKLLFTKSKITRAKDLHLVIGIFVLAPLLFAAGTGFLIELNTLFWSNKAFDTHSRPESCSFDQQLSVLEKLNPQAGRINFCRPDHPYMSYISKTETKEITPDGIVVQSVLKDQWRDNFFYRKHHFVHLHGGDDFGIFKTPYRLFIGMGLFLLNITGLIIWWKKRKSVLPAEKVFDISNSSTPTKA